jgi:hypothetical protein
LTKDECSQIVIESRDPIKTSMLSFDSISFQCELVEHYLKPHIRSILSDQNSPYEINFEYLSSTIAKYANKPNCNDLENEDVRKFILSFKYCSSIFKKLSNSNIMIHPNIDQATELNISSICIDNNLIDSYNYLIEKSYYFKEKNGSLIQDMLHEDDLETIEPPVVKYASIYLSVNKRDAKFLLPFYRYYLEPNFLSKSTLNLNENKNFMIKGLNFDIKLELFDIYIWSSLIYIIIAVFFISIIILFYVKSLVLTTVFFSCNLFSLLESFFILVLILKIEFLPFINVLSVFIVLSVSCNNLFIIFDTWLEAKLKYNYLLISKYQVDTRMVTKSMPVKDNQNSRKNIYYNNAMLSLFLENSLRYTLRNAVRPILITNLTIAMSFLVSLSSSIIAIKLFGLFTALAIIINFFLQILLVLSCLIMFIKYSSSLNGICIQIQGFKARCFNFDEKCIKFKHFIQIIKYYYQNFFEVGFPNFIISIRCVSILLLFLLGIGALVLICLKPGWKFQNSATSFQFFANSNPFEYYEQHFSALSETNGIYMYQNDKKPFVKVNFIFGLTPRGSSNHFRSDDYGTIEFDRNFNFYDEKYQIWLDRFCASLQVLEARSDFTIENNSFDKLTEHLNFTSELFLDEGQKNICLFDLLRSVLTRECPIDAEANDVVNVECCDCKFPFDPDTLETCMKNSTFLSQFIYSYHNSLYEKIYFNNGYIKAIEYEQVTSFSSSTNNAKISELYNKINEFFNEQLQVIILLNASMNQNTVLFKQQNGFFVADFDFFDFKNSLLNGAIKSFFITLTAFFLILLLSTRNIFVTLFSFFDTILSLLCTIGTLNLFEYKLNLIEYLSLISVIGFSINYLIHFSLFYNSKSSKKNCQEANIFFVKENNTKNVVKLIGSAVFASSLTSVVAAVSLTLSNLIYFQTYGIFILLTIFYSLLYSCFFFLPLCSIISSLTDKFACFTANENETYVKNDYNVKRNFRINKRLDESGYTTS